MEGLCHALNHLGIVQPNCLYFCLAAFVVIVLAIGHGAPCAIAPSKVPPEPGRARLFCLLVDAQLPLVLFHNLRRAKPKF